MNIPGKPRDGQILVRESEGQWVWVDPKTRLSSREERWMLAGSMTLAAMLAVLGLVIWYVLR